MYIVRLFTTKVEQFKKSEKMTDGHTDNNNSQKCSQVCTKIHHFKEKIPKIFQISAPGLWPRLWPLATRLSTPPPC